MAQFRPEHLTTKKKLHINKYVQFDTQFFPGTFYEVGSEGRKFTHIKKSVEHKEKIVNNYTNFQLNFDD